MSLGPWFLAAFAAAAPAAQDPPPAASRPVAQVGRIAEQDAPRIDGRLSDPCWSTAPAIGELTMVEPWEGRAPTQPTVVKLLHDRHHLYIGLWCYDDPAAVVARMRARDAQLDPDDRVEIMLDPLESRQIAYFFQVGAAGSIGDALISANGNRFDKPWDTIWRGEVQRTEQGWFAELAIPFRSLPRRAGGHSWGFNLQRLARTRNEVYRWAFPNQRVRFYRPSEVGTLEGFGEVDSGHGVDVVPYAALNVSRDRAAANADWRFDPDAGGEVYWQLSPSMRLATTVFTDFAETEADGRQINLNRFPLFFPEKRDFFLDGSGYFQSGPSDAGGMTFLPFFSRRIGLAGDGTPIPILAGVKLSGRAGPWEIGLLDVETDASATTDEENLAVGRVRYSLADETAVGLIATHGNPRSTGDNSVLGADFYHRWPRFVGDLDLQVQFDALASQGAGDAADGESYAVDLRSRGREWTIGAGMRWVADDFRPELGFVSRRGTRVYAAEVGWRPRLGEGSGIRNWVVAVAGQRYETKDGSPQEVRLRLDRLGLELQSSDTVYLSLVDQFERVEEDFLLFGGSTPVFAGDYETLRGGATVATSQGRPWNVEVKYETGEFFDGTSDAWRFDGSWRTSALLHLGATYATDDVDLGPGRAFTTQIAAARVELHLSSSLSLYNLVQFDNESDELAWQARLRWIYAEGCDFFAVLGTSWLRDDGSFAPTEQALALKVQHTLRF